MRLPISLVFMPLLWGHWAWAEQVLGPCCDESWLALNHTAGKDRGKNTASFPQHLFFSTPLHLCPTPANSYTSNAEITDLAALTTVKEGTAETKQTEKLKPPTCRD